MHIVTWNVNGLRAALRKQAFDWLPQEEPDVVCLQEIKARPDQLSESQLAQLDGYQLLWHPAERPGYSGVATLVRETPPDYRLGLGVERFDIEGRALGTRHDGFWLFNLYVPNGSRDHSRVPFKLDFYADLLAECERLRAGGEGVILCGDFNTAHQEIDLRNPKSNRNTSGFLDEEREWVGRLIDAGYIDVYRQLYPEKEQYTWWAQWGKARARNVGWRLDYFLVSEELLPRVRQVEIHDERQGSDHCPVSLHLD